MVYAVCNDNRIICKSWYFCLPAVASTHTQKVMPVRQPRWTRECKATNFARSQVFSLFFAGLWPLCWKSCCATLEEHAPAPTTSFGREKNKTNKHKKKKWKRYLKNNCRTWAHVHISPCLVLSRAWCHVSVCSYSCHPAAIHLLSLLQVTWVTIPACENQEERSRDFFSLQFFVNEGDREPRLWKLVSGVTNADLVRHIESNCEEDLDKKT